MDKQKKLSFPILISMVIGAVVGGAVFNLPADMAKSGTPIAILIAWVIMGIGVIALAFCFQNLGRRRPEIHGGLFNYANHGYGPFVGSLMGWGHWLSCWLGDVAYMVLIFSTLSYFFPIFEQGTNLYSMIGGSILLWSCNGLVLSGVRNAAVVNMAMTIGKYVPFTIFILVMLALGTWGKFSMQLFDFTGLTWGILADQVGNSMMVGLWAFIGIEGAITISERAKSHADVGKATVFGVMSIIATYVLISFAAYGFLTREEIIALPNPSMAYILEAAIGRTGAILINLGLLISILGAYLGWIIVSNEIFFVGSRHEKLYPKFTSTTNSNGSAVGSIIFTGLCVQIFLIYIYLDPTSSYRTVFYLSATTQIIPYLVAAMFQWQVVSKRQGYEAHESTIKDKIWAVLGIIFAILLIWASGLETLYQCAILYLPGILFYAIAYWQKKKGIF